MGVILILGRTEDPCCRLVYDQLLTSGRETWLLPEDQLLPGLGFDWKPSSKGQQGSISYNGRETEFAQVSGVLSRAWGVPVSPEDFETSDGRYICAEWNALLMAWLSGMQCPVINRLRPELWYKSHLNVPDLASLVPGISLKLPRSLVTTDIDDAYDFCRSLRGPVRYSPLTRPSRYRIATAADRAQLSALSGSLPLYLTEWVEGRHVEAFVARSEVLFVDQNGRIEDDAPRSIARHCTEITNTLGLTFSKLSLAAGTDRDWYCVGVDRTPQLYDCAEETRIVIAQALVRAIVRATGPE
jgi:hypothetical protein